MLYFGLISTIITVVKPKNLCCQVSNNYYICYYGVLYRARFVVSFEKHENPCAPVLSRAKTIADDLQILNALGMRVLGVTKTRLQKSKLLVTTV